MSTKLKIINFLKTYPGYVSGSQLEDNARTWQTKASTISRRARELADDGVIEAEHTGIHKVVRYRLVLQPTPEPQQLFDSDYLIKRKELL